MTTFYDDADKSLANTIEGLIKDANINGISIGGVPYAASIMTSGQYAPGSAPTLPRDCNRETAIAIVNAIRSAPMRVAIYSKTTLPLPVAGGVIFVNNGSALDGPVLGFSDGVSWFACDTLLPIA